MSSKAKFLIGALLVAAVYWGFVRLHQRFDAAPYRGSVPEVAIDASDIWRTLAVEGLSGLDKARSTLRSLGRDPLVAEMDALLPEATEPWNVAVIGLLATPSPVTSPLPVGIEFIEPIGLAVPGRLFVALRCAAPGRAELTLERLDPSADSRPAAVAFEGAIGRRIDAPAATILELGAKYRLSARRADDSSVHGSIEIAVIDAAQEARLRECFDTLKRGVVDLTIRRFAQASVAMTMGIDGEAYTILSELSRTMPPDGRRGIDERLVWLYRQRGAHESSVALVRRLGTVE